MVALPLPISRSRALRITMNSELPPADRAPGGIFGDEHEGAGFARRGALGFDNVDEDDGAGERT